MTDVGRLADLLDRAAGTMLHVELDRISPLAVPVIVLIGRESVAQKAADDALLIEAEALAAEAMAAVPPCGGAAELRGLIRSEAKRLMPASLAARAVAAA